MTQIYLTIGIIVIIAALVCYIFIRQTINERKQEKDRLHRALSKRAKELLQMISAFPDNFLPQELVVFIYRCIIDAYEQLTKLSPSETQYIEALKIHSSQLEGIIRKQSSGSAEDLQSSAQINELRQYLNLLSGFLQKSMQRSHITQKQHAHYRLLVKELIIRLAINNYMISAKQSLDIKKTKLAIHYYDLAKKLLVRETPSHYKERIEKINAHLKPLLEMEEIMQAEQNALKAEESEEDKGEKSEWDEFEDKDGWKKKNVYD